MFINFCNDIVNSFYYYKNYKLGANEDFVIFFTSNLITYFIDGFTLKMKSQSIAQFLNESEDIHWILDLEGEVHSIWDLWISSGLQKCKGNGFMGQAGISFWLGPKILDFLEGRLPLPESTSPKSP